MPLNPQPPIPEPDYDDPKEVYAFFGLAAYNVQCFEQSVILLIAALKAKAPSQIKEANFNEIFDILDKQTLGRLRESLSKVGNADRDVIDLIKRLLPRRNYLMHHFWVAHSENIMAAAGRKKMLGELCKLIQEFHECDRVIVDAYMSAWTSLGLKEKEIQEYIEKMREAEAP